MVAAVVAGAAAARGNMAATCRSTGTTCSTAPARTCASAAPPSSCSRSTCSSAATRPARVIGVMAESLLPVRGTLFPHRQRHQSGGPAERTERRQRSAAWWPERPLTRDRVASRNTPATDRARAGRKVGSRKVARRRVGSITATSGESARRATTTRPRWPTARSPTPTQPAHGPARDFRRGCGPLAREPHCLRQRPLPSARASRGPRRGPRLPV